MIALSNLLGLLPVAQSGGSFWLPPPDSTTAGAVDALFYFILGVSAFFFGLIVVLMCVFVVRYRRRPGQPLKAAPSHNTLLEVVWTAIPVAIVAYIFHQGYTAYLEMRTPPGDAYEIRVTAKKWSWLFTYPNGYYDEDLHVPVDRPVRLVMSSRDVIHSLFIPAFRVKMDVVPGRYNTTWFRAVKPGEYDLLCAEYCGRDHSAMLAKVIVHEPGEFEPWLEKAAARLQNLTPAERGRMLYLRLGCSQCHTVDGTPRVGPTFKGAYGHTVQFNDGTSTTVDDNYIRQSILDPQAKIVAGYQPQMPPYQGMVSEDDLVALIEYIKSLK